MDGDAVRLGVGHRDFAEVAESGGVFGVAADVGEDESLIVDAAGGCEDEHGCGLDAAAVGDDSKRVHDGCFPQVAPSRRTHCCSSGFQVWGQRQSLGTSLCHAACCRACLTTSNTTGAVMTLSAWRGAGCRYPVHTTGRGVRRL